MKPVWYQVSGNVSDQIVKHLLNNVSIQVWRLAIDQVRTRSFRDDITDNTWFKMR